MSEPNKDRLFIQKLQLTPLWLYDAERIFASIKPLIKEATRAAWRAGRDSAVELDDRHNSYAAQRARALEPPEDL